jgi:type II secretory pathway pseudopilin PulG
MNPGSVKRSYGECWSNEAPQSVISAPQHPNAAFLHPARSFSLIEMIGVLAVMAILAAALVPSIIRRIDRAAWTKETDDLNSIADSLTQAILRTKSVPTFANIASTVASQMSLPVSAISTNSRRFARAFLIDRNLSIGGGLPYTQTNTGTAKPANARVMIVSSLGRALPIVSSNNLPDAEFNAIWNTAEGAKPSTSTWTSWAGNGDDLRIKKLNLEPLFYQLILIDHDTANPALFSIDSTSTNTVPTGGLGWNKYYLDGTVVGLHDGAGLVQTRYLLQRSISFVFESDAWSGPVQGGQSIEPLADAFAVQAASFYASANNPAPNNGGASPYSVLVLMYSFLYDYTLWANECPHFDDHGTSSSPEVTLLKAVIGPSANGSLGAVSGAGGLLK